MRNTFFLVFTIICFISTAAQAQGIVFEKGQWADILKKAADQNKPIFVDAYTTWCGPCKWMAKNTFTDEKVGLVCAITCGVWGDVWG